MATIGLITVIIAGILLLVCWIGLTLFFFSGLGATSVKDYIYYIATTIVLLGASFLCFYYIYPHFSIKII